MKTPLAHRRPRPGTILLTFLYVWLMVGFFTGTVVLVGPIRWLTEWVQGSGWTQRMEDWAVMSVIASYVVTSFYLSRWLLRRMYFAEPRPVRLGVPAVVTLAAMGAAWSWNNPGEMLAGLAGGEAEEIALSSGAEFFFGPYPDRQRLAELKAQGITTIVSLQHPSIPVEAPGIAKEKVAIRDLGLELIHTPMLPWVSDNEESLARLRALAESGQGKYYVHCGLGRDRVNLAKRVIESAGRRTIATEELKEALTFADRQLEARRGERNSAAFEHGALLEMEIGVWLIPHPNAHEMAGYLLSGQVARVVSLLDPSDPRQQEWREEQRRALSSMQVPAEFIPLLAGDTATARRIAQSVRGGARPVAVIVPETHPEDARLSEGAARTFLEAYQKVQLHLAPESSTASAPSLRAPR